MQEQEDVNQNNGGGPAVPGTVRPGSTFAGRYRIENELGAGAMGAVWSAFDEAVGDVVAVKFLTAGADAAERFRREVRLARKVTHRNAARTFDLGEAEGLLYLTMELVVGESLAARLRRESPLAPAEAMRIAHQVALGLAAAHRVDVVHRDLKPANVLLESATGRVVLTDFGLARATESDPLLSGHEVALIGTPAYMAPEQVAGDEIGPSTDLYALGLLLYEMATGGRAFAKPTPIASALARLQDDPEDPRSSVPLPLELAELILHCLQRRPEQRPANASLVAGRLAALLTTSRASDDHETLYGGPGGAALSRAAAPASSFASRSAGGFLSSVSGAFPTASTEEPNIAVLPFRSRGPGEQAKNAESLAEELTDVLSMTRGFKTAAIGASSRYRENSDPREAGRELGVDVIVDGSTQSVAGQLRVSIRLHEVATGLQLWVGHFEGSLDEPYDVLNALAQRIAEALRIELELFACRSLVDEETIELFLQARRRMAENDLSGNGLQAAIDLFERCLQRAPRFGPALAARAEACVRRWFLPAGDSQQEIVERAHESVRLALAEAGSVAQTHFAAARLAVSDGDFSEAAQQLATTLRIAPTYAVAREYLGALQCEAGRVREGLRQIELAHRVVPSLVAGVLALARARAFDGDEEAALQLLLEVRAESPPSHVATYFHELRIANWRQDHAALRRCLQVLAGVPQRQVRKFFETLCTAALGEADAAQLENDFAAALETRFGPRLQSFARQMVVEVLAQQGEIERAVANIHELVKYGDLVDVDWLERCPALASVRHDPRFEQMLITTRRRADALWTS